MIRGYVQRRLEAKRLRIQAELAFIEQYRDPLPCHAKPMADKRDRLRTELTTLESRLSN